MKFSTDVDAFVRDEQKRRGKTMVQFVEDIVRERMLKPEVPATQPES